MRLDTTTPSRPHPVHPHAAVVAGLVNDGSALAVARAALAEAQERGGRITFVQVVAPGLGAEERADANEGTFHAAMVVLRGHPQVHSTFEVVMGDVAQTLVNRSRDAGILIVGEDDPASRAGVARYCQEHADCEVRTVTADAPEPL